MAGTLDDFRTAASSEGVNLIPFYDLRRDATAIADEIQSRKDEAQRFDYNVFEKQKNDLFKEIKELNRQLEIVRKDIQIWKDNGIKYGLDKLEEVAKKLEDDIKVVGDNNNGKIQALNKKIT
jgi:hypothetical protein